MLLHLEHDRGSVSSARRWFLRRAAAAGLGGEAHATVELLTSELVANALLHGPHDGRVTVRTAVVDGVFEVAVTDEGAGSPIVKRPPPTAEGGRGVMLVDMLTASGGTRMLDDGSKAVWFTIRT